MSEEENDKKSYELSFLVKDEAQAATVLGLVRQFEGAILFEGPVKKITLSYPIKKETMACFGFIHFSLLPAKAPELQHALEMKEEILRALLIDLPPALPERKRMDKPMPTEPEMTVSLPPLDQPTGVRLSNEELEKKIEEILK